MYIIEGMTKDYVISNELKTELKSTLREEKENRYKGGIFAYLSKKLAYNSNKIEGTSLTYEHTEDLFNYNAFSSEDRYISNEIEEMNGHFLMFNHYVDNIEKSNLITIDFIKSLHYELKIGVSMDRLNGYAIGDFKKRRDMIGDAFTTNPEDVEKEIIKLLNWFETQKEINLEKIAEFHLRYEKIHPFQKGNGRTGRIIIFIMSLENKIIPPIIKDDDGSEYLKCLSNDDIGRLTKLLQKSQLDVKEKIEYFFELEK